MSKFKVGDSVKVVREFRASRGEPGWVLDMDKTLGMIGKVHSVMSKPQHPSYNYDEYDGCCVIFPDGVRWSYLDSALDLEDEEIVPVSTFFSGFL